MKIELVGEQLSAWFDREESYPVTAWWDAALLELLGTISGCTPGEIRRIVFQRGDELDPGWRELWVTPGGVRLEYVGAAVMSRHGCHGQTMKVRVTGLPEGVAFSASWHVDHRSGGSFSLKLVGVPGLAELEASLRARVA